jgi:hypothetical protein
MEMDWDFIRSSLHKNHEHAQQAAVKNSPPAKTKMNLGAG